MTARKKTAQALEARPENARSLKDYASLVSAYQRVYLITPHAAEVPAALNQVAELYRTMGDLFDEKYYQSAVDSYQFLLREYPTSRYREDAMLAIAQIEQDDLHDSVLAQKSYEEFLALHPRSSHAAEVRAILDKLNGAKRRRETRLPSLLIAKDRGDADRLEGLFRRRRLRLSDGYKKQGIQSDAKAPRRQRFGPASDRAFALGMRTPIRAS